MGRIYERIDEHQRTWIAAQSMFFVGTAPSGDSGHINVSPKGPIGSLRVIDERTVAYLDIVGSGAETIAHLRENGRIVVMFCAFDGPPKIVRLHGRGRTVRPDDAEFAALRANFAKARTIGQRAIVLIDVDRVSDSCGLSVPTMAFVGDRDGLDRSQERRDQAYMEQYWQAKNAVSIDGLPAI